MKAFIAIGFFFITIVCFSQPDSIKLYAYRQTSLPGIPSSENKDEKGKLIEEKKSFSLTYSIYFTFSKDKTISLLELWLNGKVFGIEQQTILSTPIEYSFDNNSFQPQKMVLVPFTNNKVLKLSPIEKLPGKISLAKKTLATTNELIVVYEENNKVNLKTVKKIKNLPPAIRE